MEQGAVNVTEDNRNEEIEHVSDKIEDEEVQWLSQKHLFPKNGKFKNEKMEEGQEEMDFDFNNR